MAEQDKSTPAADFDKTLALARRSDDGDQRGPAVWELLGSCQGYLEAIAERSTDPALQRHAGPSDLVNEALLDAHDCIDQFRGRTEGQLRRWLGTILRTRINRARRRKPAATLSLPDSSYGRFDPALVARNTPPSEFARRAETTANVRHILAEMPEHYRRVLVLHFVDRRTEEEIAREMGTTQAAVHGYLLRAVRKLRAKLAHCR